MSAQILQFRNTEASQSLDHLAAQMLETERNLDKGKQSICNQLSDQVIFTVAKAIVKFEDLYYAGKGRDEAVKEAVILARSGEL